MDDPFTEIPLTDYKKKPRYGLFGYPGYVLYKSFHPGNTLTLAFILLGIGLCLIACGVACPLALVLAAVFFSNVSMISAIAYGAHWLYKDYRQYKKTSSYKITGSAPYGSFSGHKPPSYLTYCLGQLRAWGEQHKWQRFFMGVGFLLFLTALILVIGYAAAPVAFGFMAAGAYGGAIGLVSQIFASPFCIGATLVLGPVNLLDTLRRLCSGIYKQFFGGGGGDFHQIVDDYHLSPNLTYVSNETNIYPSSPAYDTPVYHTPEPTVTKQPLTFSNTSPTYNPN